MTIKGMTRGNPWCTWLLILKVKNQGKTVKPTHYLAIWSFLLMGQEEKQTLIGYSGRGTHVTWNLKSKRTKVTVFNLLNSPFMLMVFDIFMLVVGVRMVGNGMWVKIFRHQKKVGWNRQPQKADSLISRQAQGPQFGVWREKNSPRLKRMFNGYIVTDFR